jgi:hypothetical protein
MTFARDPLDSVLDSAPPDDEPVTAEEEEGANEAREDLRRGDIFDAESIKREFG